MNLKDLDNLHGFFQSRKKLRDHFAGQVFIALGEDLLAAYGKESSVAKRCFEIAEALVEASFEADYKYEKSIFPDGRP